MKKMLLSLVLCYYTTAMAQKIGVQDLSDHQELNYTFAFLEPHKVIFEKLYNQFLNLSIYPFNDWLATPENFSPTDGEDVLKSYIISVRTADLYSPLNKGKLFKIVGLYDPKILEIKETKYPYFTVTIEYGAYDQRQEKVFTLKGED